LSSLRHDKRKKIRQERRKVQDAGISFRHILGKEIRSSDWDFFYRCYCHTHEQYNSPLALTRNFFTAIGNTMPSNILLIIAYRNNAPVASALNFLDEYALYGRSWGAIEYHPALHFETCYYQAIDFCIAQRLRLFEGGAQGEHKLARGFLPHTTWSAHWLARPEFSEAVEHFLESEAGKISEYMNELEESNPFKREK
jgi:predicted N-acyltransferase